MAIGWPEGIYLALVFVSHLAAANLHGKRRDRPHSYFDTLIATAIMLPLLWWGGFFS